MQKLVAWPGVCLLAITALACDGTEPLDPQVRRDDQQEVTGQPVTVYAMGWYECHDHGDDPPPGDDPPEIITLLEWECHWVPGPSDPVDPDPGDDEGGGGGTAPTNPDDPYAGNYGSLVYDDVFGDEAATGTPRCWDYANLSPEEQYWCDGTPPNLAEVRILNDAASQVIARCPWLASHWERARYSIRLNFEALMGIGGAARRFDDWILLSYEWVHGHSPELGLGHELLHLAGYRHRNAQERSAFHAKEMECTAKSSANMGG